MLKM
jgi:hypothetical protein